MDFNRFDISTKELVWDDPAAWLEGFGIGPRGFAATRRANGGADQRRASPEGRQALDRDVLANGVALFGWIDRFAPGRGSNDAGIG